jgi:hypothetical protein
MRKWPLERMRRTWKDNLKTGLGKVGCENKIRPYLCPGHVGIDSVEQGCTNSRSPRILRWLLFGKFVHSWY